MSSAGPLSVVCCYLMDVVLEIFDLAGAIIA